MFHDSPATGYARLSPRQARLVLAAWVLMTCFCVGITLSPLASGRADVGARRGGDVALYRAEIDRIHAGQGYYQAAAAELRGRGYPTGSVFNWRFPTPFWLIGWMPDAAWGKALLGGLSLVLMLLAFETLARDRQTIGRSVACVGLLTGPLMFSFLSDLFVMPVLWAGVLIGLSICAYGMGRPRWGVALGLAAVFLRELAMPYCLVCAALAWWHGRRGEVWAWIVGLTVFAMCLGLHCWHVSGLIRPTDRLHAQGWVQFGGTPFVIATAQMNAYLLLLPQWITAVYLVAAMFGFAGWNTPLGQRVGLTACLFVVAFAVAGHEFNQYWGSLMTPLLCFGAARFRVSLRETWHAARWTRAWEGLRVAD